MRIIRKILWVICILALLAIGSVVALYFLVTPASVQDRLQSSLNQMGFVMRANELPIVRVLPTISVDLPSAQLFDSQNKLIAIYRSAHFNVSPVWLIFDQIHIEKILVDGFSLQETECPSLPEWLKNNSTTDTALIDGLTVESIEFNDSDIHLKHDGRLFNLQNLRAVISSPAPQMHAPVALSTQIQILPENLLLDVQAGFSLDLNLASGKVAIENLSVQTSGTQQGKSFQAQLDSPLTQLSAEAIYTKTAKVQITGDQSLGDVSLSVAELHISQDSWQAPDFHIQYNKGAGDQTLKVDLRSPIIFDTATTFTTADHIQGSISLPEQAESIPVSGNVKIDWNKEKIHSEIFARLHGAPMTFRGESAGFDFPDIKGDLVFGRLELSDLSVFRSLQRAQATLPATLLPQQSEVQTSASNEANVEAQPSELSSSGSQEDTSVETTVETDTSRVSQADGDQSEVTKEHSHEGSNEVSSVATSEISDHETADIDSSLPFDFLNHFDFNGSIVIGELSTGPVKLVQLKSNMQIQKGVLKLPKAKALTYDGKTELDVQLNAQGHWNVVYRGESINLSSLLNDASGNSKVGGILNLQANLYGGGFTQQALNGQIGFSASQAKLFGFNLEDATVALKQYKEPEQKNDLFTETEHFGGVVTIHDGRAVIDNLGVNFGSSRARGQAQVDLNNHSLTGQLTGRSNGLDLTINLAGQWQSPIAVLDTEQIRKANNLVAKPQPKEEKKPSGWDKLKDFFRNRF